MGDRAGPGLERLRWRPVGGLDGKTLGFNICTRIRALDAIPFKPGATHNRPAQPAAAARPIQSLAQLREMSDAIRFPPVIPNGVPRPRWNLGEQDPGAVPGGLGAALTRDTNGTNHLAAFGTPTYSAIVPASGSTLSMSFNGSSYYQGGGTGISNLFRGFDFNNVSLTCEVYPTALGSAGFSFPFSVGGGGTGFAIVESGGHWRLLNHNVGFSPVGPPVLLNTWTRLEVVRRDFGAGVEARLLVNGVYTGAAISTSPYPPADILYVGANRVASGMEGQFRGLIDNVVLDNAAPVLLQALQTLPATNVLAGATMTLSATAAGGGDLDGALDGFLAFDVALLRSGSLPLTPFRMSPCAT